MSVKLLILMFAVVGSISYSTREDIAKRLKERYKNNVKECEKGKSAYQCSGIMLRGVDIEQKLPVPWGMKDKNKEKEAFSMVFLIKDQQFDNVHGCDSGFILYPHLETPHNKNTYKMYCTFPFNGYTDFRDGHHGCGTLNGKPKSEHCDKLHIESFDAWKSYYQTPNFERPHRLKSLHSSNKHEHRKSWRPTTS